MAHLCRWVFNGLAALLMLLLFATVMLLAWDSHKGNPTIWSLTDIQANSAYYRVGVHANSVVILRARPWPPVWEPVNWGEFDPPIDFLGLHARWASSGPIRGGVPNSSWFFVEAPFLWIVAAAVFFLRGGASGDFAYIQFDLPSSVVYAATTSAPHRNDAANVEQSCRREK